MASPKLDLPQIKSEIKTLLDDNNTTTSSLIDLSSGMSRRVQQVIRLNPEKIPPQPSLFPCISIYTDRKNIESSDIAVNQAIGKRKAEVDFKILGIVFNTDYSTDIFNDAADEDLEELMENVESLLRNDHNLNDSVKWQIATDVAYHSSSIGEDAYMRIGELTIKATVFY